MRKSAAGSQVCWTCLKRRLQPSRPPFSLPGSRTFTALRARGASPAGRRDFATVQDAAEQDSQIRQQLRQWEAENKIEAPMGMPSDNGSSGSARNLLTRARNRDEVAQEADARKPEIDEPTPDADGALEVLPPPPDFRAGDLIEMHEDGDRMALLAVCLGFINGSYHFYTADGKWLPTQGMISNFVVRRFVSEELLQPLIDQLPKETLPQETLTAMKHLKMGPDRVSGSLLLRKMAKFQEQYEFVLQQNATLFENAHKILVDAGKRYLTLEDISACLLGNRGRPSPINPLINMATLYAVHRTITGDDIGFRRLGNFGKSCLYEITAPEDVALISNMQVLVRLFTDIPGKLYTPLTDLTSAQLSQSQLGRFILKAREAVDYSRQFREWTPHGVLGPSKKPRPLIDLHWTDVDMSILHFMHLWAGYDQFSPSSRFHWIGSAILRATARYKDSEYLSMSTAWTFLQETGYITPWDIHARYTQRLPGVKPSRESGYTRITLGPGGVSTYLTPDPFIEKRKEWTDQRVFAVDSRDTTDIDDAVSIEAAETPGEHWIHVHVADPASRIRPQSALGERAQLVPLNLYLPGHDSNIWGVGDEIQKLFSLGPNKPCFTFSGKVNEQGELLDYKITPGKLHNYIFITPEEVNAAVGYKDPRRSPTWSSTENFRVGKKPARKAENRKMTTAAELQPEDLEALKTLHRLADAIRQRRLAKGAMPVFSLRPNVKVSFDETSMKNTPPGHITCDGDPTISISWDGGGEAPMVTNTMTLAGEVAARWCADRKIPIPYVSQPTAQKNLEALKQYTENVYYPILLRGEEPTPEQSSMLRRLLGADELSTKPGPHFLMGVDCYAKVTSPLRRYSDLLAHWQIQDVLLQEMEAEEAKAGGKVVAAAKPRPPPFERDILDGEIFPWMRLRQRVIRRLGGSAGTEAYIHQALLRAWKFPASAAGQGGGGGGSRLPDTFRFRVDRALHGYRKLISGTLDWFGVGAYMVPDGLSALGVRVADLRKDDVFEVKLRDVNVYDGDVHVEAVGKVRFQGDVRGSVVDEAVAKAKVVAEA